jgi:hypothetical protein
LRCLCSGWLGSLGACETRTPRPRRPPLPALESVLLRVCAANHFPSKVNPGRNQRLHLSPEVFYHYPRLNWFRCHRSAPTPRMM